MQQAVIVYVCVWQFACDEYGESPPFVPSIDDENGRESRPKEFISQLGSYASTLSLSLFYSPPTANSYYSSFCLSLFAWNTHCTLFDNCSLCNCSLFLCRKKSSHLFLEMDQLLIFNSHHICSNFEWITAERMFFFLWNKSATCVGEGHSVRDKKSKMKMKMNTKLIMVRCAVGWLVGWFKSMPCELNHYCALKST